VIFGRNDLLQDAPISRIDLLVCRNTLMYFTAKTQAQIVRRFHFALDDDGYLLLGKSEMLITHADLFAPVELKRRVFRKVIKPAQRDRLRVMAGDAARGYAVSQAETVREAAFDVGGPPQIVLDHNRALVMANDSARRMFGVGRNDFGRPVQDLELSYRPVELRSHLDGVDRELRHPTEEVNDVNSFLEAILGTIGLAAAVLDRNQRVQMWNGRARELWGVTPAEAEEEDLRTLDIGLPLDQVRPKIRAVLTGDSRREEVVVAATNRRGKPFQCHVTVLAMGGTDGSAPGAIMTMEALDA
jgi:PAS domain S-box-containing protein